MLNDWLKITKKALNEKNKLHVASKLIVRGMTCTVPLSSLMESDLTLDMLGFQKKKQTMLTDYYYHEESVKIALSQLAYRRQKKTYGSCGVTTYAHFSKKERPQHGPCIQSLVFTHLPSGVVNLDVFYRTTELFKKFAADLIWLREVMLPQFELSPSSASVTFHFANATYHPMYWATAMPHYDDPISELNYIKQVDPTIFKSTCRWTYRFLEQSDSLLKFKQGYRVSKHLHRLADSHKLKELKQFIAKYYTPKEEPDDDQDGEL